MIASFFNKDGKLILGLLLIMLTLHFLFLVSSGPQLLNLPGSVVNQLVHIVCTLIILARLAQIPRRELTMQVRLFWFCITTAFGFWLLTKISLLTTHILALSDWVFLLADYGYFAFFLVTVFSLLFYGSAQQQENHKEVNRSLLNQYGAIFFMGALFVYLVIVPNQSKSSEFTHHFSSYLFFILMDVYLAIAFLTNALHAEQTDWRRRFMWLSATFMVYLVLDSIELATRSELITWKSDGIASLIWFIPYLTLALAFIPKLPTARVAAVPLPSWLPSALTITMAILPLLHAIGHSIDLFQGDLKDIRENILIVWVLVYLIFINIIEKQGQDTSAEPEQQSNEPKLAPEALTIKLDSVPYPLFLLDNLGRILHTNNATSELTGYSENQLKSEFFAGLLAKDEPLEPLLRFSETTFSESKLVTSGTREVHIQHKDGQKLVCYISFAEVDSCTFTVSLIDITKLHEAEQQALSIKDKFLANITHEFRTPLTIIQGAVEEGVEHITDEALQRRFLSAKSNTIRVLKMVEQLLNLSKITSAPKLSLSVQPASEIVKDCCLQFEPLCRQKDITFASDVNDNLWINVQEDALQQILYNLLSNAFKYSEQNGEIRLAAVQEQQKLYIEISDTGCGMTEEEQERLFERFQRADAAKRSNTFGVGIGLSLVSELIQLHNWQISVRSKLNEGTKFKMSIPLVAAPVELAQNNTFEGNKTISFELEDTGLGPTHQIVASEGKQEAGDNSVNQERLLIVEDNLDMQEYLRHLMAPLYQTEIVGRGQLGIDRAIQEIPDIIICDLMLPDITGYEVVEALKKNPVTQHIPILMLTAKADIQSKLKGLEKRADDYLTKPFHYKELQLRLQNLLDIRQKMQMILRQKMNQESFHEARQNALPDNKEAPEVMPHQQFLSRLQAIAEKHFAEEAFGLTLLADNMAMSERQLQRKLKAALDMTPGEYIREYRLIKARDLLAEGKGVGLVAEQVGFSNQAYFARCFKQQTGQTPSEFQKSATSSDSV